MNHTIPFIKIRKVESPRRSSTFEAGIDFFVPVLDQVFMSDLKKANPLHGTNFTILNRPGSEPEIELFTQGKILIPSGIKVYLPHHTCLQVNNKSGIASKNGVIFTAEVVDSTYYGEVHLGVINVSRKDFYITSGMKLLQMLHLPILLSELEEIGDDEYNSLIEARPSDRGDKGFGSNFEIKTN